VGNLASNYWRNNILAMHLIHLIHITEKEARMWRSAMLSKMVMLYKSDLAIRLEYTCKVSGCISYYYRKKYSNLTLPPTIPGMARNADNFFYGRTRRKSKERFWTLQPRVSRCVVRVPAKNVWPLRQNVGSILY